MEVTSMDSMLLRANRVDTIRLGPPGQTPDPGSSTYSSLAKKMLHHSLTLCLYLDFAL